MRAKTCYVPVTPLPVTSTSTSSIQRQQPFRYHAGPNAVGYHLIGEYLATRLESLRKCDVVREVRGRGILRGVELVQDTRTLEPFPELGNALKQTSLDNGLILRIDPSWFAVAPALIATKATSTRCSNSSSARLCRRSTGRRVCTAWHDGCRKQRMPVRSVGCGPKIAMPARARAREQTTQ
jgi:hypothetical protein